MPANSSLRPGDLLECVDTSLQPKGHPKLVKGKVYIVKVITSDGYVRVTANDATYRLSRFKLVQQARHFQVGDVVECIDALNQASGPKQLEKGQLYIIDHLTPGAAYLRLGGFTGTYGARRFKYFGPAFPRATPEEVQETVRKLRVIHDSMS